MIWKPLRAIARLGQAIVLLHILTIWGSLPVQSSPGLGELLVQAQESTEEIESPGSRAIEPQPEEQPKPNRMVPQNRWSKMKSFLDRHPETLYIVLVLMLISIGLGTLGTWLVWFKLRKLNQPQKVIIDRLTLETLTELKNLFVETQNSLFWLQDYLENAANQTPSRSTSDWSSFSRSIRDSQVFEPDTSHRRSDRSSDSHPNSASAQISNSVQANELVKRGDALLGLGCYESAIAVYEQSIRLSPNCHQAWLQRGCALFSLQEYEQAIASYDEALHRTGDLADAWYNRAGALASLDRYEEAIACYERAIALKPDEPAIWYHQACCYGIQGNLDRAIENLQQAIRRDRQTYVALAHSDSDFDPIRQDPRFQQTIQPPVEISG